MIAYSFFTLLHEPTAFHFVVSTLTCLIRDLESTSFPITFTSHLILTVMVTVVFAALLFRFPPFCFNFLFVFLQVVDLQITLRNDDIDFLTAKEDYCVKWHSTDAESGIRKSEVSVCSKMNPNDCLMRAVDVGNQTSVCISDLEFKEGFQYVTKIRTENKIGLFTELFSDGFVVDTTPPFTGEVVYTDKSRTSLTRTEVITYSQISVKWDGFVDQESGIQRSYICLGTNPGECNIRNFTDVKNATSFIFKNLMPLQGERYFVAVKVENGAGLTSDVKTSDAIFIDKTGMVSKFSFRY